MKLFKATAKSLLIASLAWMISSSAFAQMTTSSQTASSLVQNVFIASGVSVQNISGTGNSQQLGKFNGGLNLIGIDSGVVLSTGNISSIPVNGFASTSYSGLGDADVLAVAQSVPWGTPPTATRDRAIIEFDFVAPQSDSVAFEYVFASEEWPSYPCSVFNDAFGFFISGPGINGSYSNNAENVSVVPGTTSLPVAITSIHNGTGSFPCNGNPSYPQFYNDGPVPNPFTYAQQNPGQFSGAFTDLFQTKPIYVNACDTYHVKLAVCDGQDWIFDSSVFLRAKSFSLLGITANPTPSYNPYGHDTALYEGCGTLDLNFTRVDSTYPPYTLTYQLAGQAVMGVDYSNVNGCTWNPNANAYDCEITFPQDSINVGLSINIFNDGIAEGIESLDIIITDSNVTNCDGSDTLALSIIDQPDLQIQPFGNTTLDCADDSTMIGVNVLNGLPPFTYQWSNGMTDSAFKVLPSQTTSYNVTVEDACGQQQEVGFVTVGVFNVPWTTVKFGDEQTLSCVDDPTTMGVEVTFNDQVWHGDISYQWSTGSTDSTITVFSTVDTTYSVTITRHCTGETVVHHFNLYAYNDPVVLETNDIPVEKIECPLDPSNIKVEASGGYPPYTYQWSNAATTFNTTVSPGYTSTYYVTVHDVCGLVDYVDSVIVNVPVPDPLRVAGIINDTVPCKESKVHFGPAVPSGGFGWGYAVSWNNFKDTLRTTQGIIHGETPFTIQVTDGCRFDTISRTVYGIIDDRSDLALELSNDTIICLGDSVNLHATAAEGGGEYSFTWSDGMKGASRTVKPMETQTYKLRLTDNCDTVRKKDVTVAVDRVDPAFEYEYISDYEVQFTDKSTATSPIRSYDWELNGNGGVFSSNSQHPIIDLPDGGPYAVILLVSDSIGCKAATEVVIQPTYHLFIPTGFTPNNDNVNDVWNIGVMGVKEFQLEIFDRWGNKVFSTTDKNFTWDGTYNGTRLPMGTYAWKMIITTDLDEYVEREGVVNILNDFQER